MQIPQALEATLAGFDGPYFPELVSRLNTLFGSPTVGFNSARFHKLGASIQGFATVIQVKTSDGYSWFWGMSFTPHNGGEIVIAFPWNKRPRPAQGAGLERSIACYGRQTTITEMEAVLLNIIRGIEETLALRDHVQ